MSSGKSIRKKSSKPGSKTATLTTHPSLPIYVPSTAPSIEDWLISLRQGSLVSRSVMPGEDDHIWTIEICGPRLGEPLMRYDHDSFCWRTSQISLITGTPEPWSGTWPPSGMTVAGNLYRPRRLVRPMSENDGSAWHIPTLTASDGHIGNLKSSQQSDDSMHSVSLPQWVMRYPVKGSTGVGGWPQGEMHGMKMNPTWREWLMGIPIGWTSVSTLQGTDSFQQWYESFSGGLHEQATHSKRHVSQEHYRE